MFEKIDQRALRNNEFVQLTDNLTTIIEKHDPVQLQFEPAFTPFKEKSLELSTFFKQRQGSKVTEKLALLDDRRDTAITGISSAVKTFTYHFDPDKKAAALLLSRSLDFYGGSIARLNYSAETSTLKDLIEKWKNEPELSQSVTTLELSSWLDELEQANNLFNEVFIDRVEDKASNPGIKIKDLRSDMGELYVTLFDHIKACTIIYGEDNYKVLIKEINTLLEEYNTILNNRKSNTEETVEETSENIE